MSDVQLLEAANAQRDQAKRATRDSLFGKKPRKQEYEAILDPDEGPVTFLLIAMGGPDYDRLVQEHQPTDKQRGLGDQINRDTFPPALLAAVVKEPTLSLDEWTQIWKSPNWAPGEVGSLYSAANELCQRTLDLNPFG